MLIFIFETLLDNRQFPNMKYSTILPPPTAEHRQAAPQSPPQVCVVGVGYVGEHLVSVFSRKYHVLGYDVSLSGSPT